MNYDEFAKQIRKGERKMKMKKCLALILGITLLVSSLAACGNTKKETTDEPTNSSTSSAGTVTTTKDGETVVTYSLSEDFYTWDPAGQPSMPSYIARILIYDTLIESDHAGNYTPSLATSWSVSEDGKDWSFQLRDDVTFSNGEPFNAECVKATFERMAKDDTLAMHYLWVNLDSVEVVDDYNCIFHFTQPYGAFLSEISVASILPAKALAEQGADLFKTNPGTGAWKFVSYDPGNETVFERNDEYWGGQKSNVDKIVFKPISEDTTRISGLKTGEINIAGDIPPDQAMALEGQEALVVQQDPGLTMCFMSLETGEGKVFSDKNARLALMHCIDRELIVDSILGSGTPAYWPTMEGVIGYDADAVNSKEYAKYDPDMAKQLLADSSYNGEEIYFMAIDGKVPRTKEVLQAIQAMMTAVGFNVKLEIMEGATFVAKRSAGEYDLGFSNIFYGNGSSLNHANMHYVSDSAHTEFVNEEQLSLINEASMTVDLDKQNELMRQAFQIAMQEGAPMQYVLSLDMFAIYTSNIENIVVFPDGVMDLRNITVK